MRKFSAASVVCLFGVALVGCAATTAAVPSASPTVTASVNAAPCKEFAAITARMADALNADDIRTAWGGVRADVDSAALAASGDVKDRMSKMVDQWPDGASLWMSRDFSELNAMIRDVGRACKADGVDSPVSTFQE